MIKTAAQLSQYLDHIEDEILLAIDTEFRRVDSYFPELCLIQIATLDKLECIDVLTLDNLEPLFVKLYDKKTKWIVHSARQDVEALFYLSGRIPSAIFDTQIAASFLNYPLQISYQSLTESLQNVRLEKKFTRFDWKKRPLPTDVLQYAIDDVRYLIPIFNQLSNELIKQNKLDWAEEECSFLINKETYRKWIMSDEKIIDYATGNNNLSSNKLHEFENFIKQNKQDFKNLNLVKISKPLSENELIRKTELKEQIRVLSIEHGLPTELICTSKNLVNFIRGIDSSSLNSGWRSKIFKI